MNGYARNTAVALGLAVVFGSSTAHAEDAQKAAAPVPPTTSNPAAPTSAAPAEAAPAAASATAGDSGLAAVYNHKLNGHKTASGERYDANKLTAAHKTLPFGTKLKVTNVKNHKSVTVRINDRGPKQQGRILDISTAAAKQLGMRPTAMAEVSTEVVAK